MRARTMYTRARPRPIPAPDLHDAAAAGRERVRDIMSWLPYYNRVRGDDENAIATRICRHCMIIIM